MRLLEDDPSISTRGIAQKVGISNGAAYYCVTALVEKGFVKLKNFTMSKSKTNYIYELTPSGFRAKAALTLQFLERKRNEYQELRLEINRMESELGLDEKDEAKVSKEHVSKASHLTCFKAYDIRGRLGEELNEDITTVRPLYCSNA